MARQELQKAEAGLPKLQMQAQAQQDATADLQQRLAGLKAACQVRAGTLSHVTRFSSQCRVNIADAQTAFFRLSRVHCDLQVSRCHLALPCDDISCVCADISGIAECCLLGQPAHQQVCNWAAGFPSASEDACPTGLDLSVWFCKQRPLLVAIETSVWALGYESPAEAACWLRGLLVGKWTAALLL